MLDQQTKRKIDSARDILVGKIPDPTAQVDQITTALIYKFMDDMDQESKSIGGQPKFFIGDFKKYSWPKIIDKKLSGQERLDLYMQAIDQLPKNEKLPPLFREIFKNAFLPYRDAETLNLFLKEINGFNYDHSENLGNAFEYLLSILGSQGDAGQFRTPRHIIDFIVEVVDPKKEESILDPACGTSGFLISSYKHIIKNNSKNYNSSKDTYSFMRNESSASSVQIQSNGKYKGENLTPTDKKRLQKNIVGYDISPKMVKLSLVNMYLHNFKKPQIYEYDTLTNTDRWEKDFNVILANPPFMTPKGGIRPHNKFSIQANRAEVLFVDYIAEHLTINGRAGIIIPEGIIFKSDKGYKALRKRLVEDLFLWAVVSLPAKVFEPYSAVKTSILFLDKKRAKNTKEILFVDVQNDGFDLGATRRKIDKNDLPSAFKVLNSWSKGRKEATDTAHWVNKKIIEKNEDYNLTGNRYKEVEEKPKKWPMVELGKILDYEQPTNYIVHSTNYSNEYNIPVLTAGKSFILGYTNEEKGIFPKRKLPVIIFDDFTTSTKFVDFPFKVKSSAMKILLPKDKEKFNIYFIFYALKNINFQPKQHKRFWISQYSKFKIPLPPVEVQKEIVAEIEGYQKIINGAKQVVENWKPTFKINPSWPLVELGKVCDLINGYAFKTRNFLKEGIPVVRISNIKNKIVDLSDTVKVKKSVKFEKYSIKTGDLLIAMSGATTGKVGLYLEKKEAYQNQRVGNFKIILKDEIESRYRNYIIMSLKEKILKKSYGGAQPNISPDKIKQIKIPLPLIEVQKEIVAEIEKEKSHVESCKELIKINQEKIKKTINKVWGT